MWQKGDLSMANQTSEELNNFLCDLKEFLMKANPNLGRKSTKREEFIATIMDKVRSFVGDPEVKPQDAKAKIKKDRENAMSDRIIRMESNEQIRKATQNKGAAIMTEEASMEADIELGNPHNMEEEK